MQENNSNGNCIIVTPLHPIVVTKFFKPMIIDTLYFWYKNTFNHSVNEDTLRFFLFHTQLFGATVYPECPELGCIAINVPASYQDGEFIVSQIQYKGEVIYTRSR